LNKLLMLLMLLPLSSMVAWSGGGWNEGKSRDERRAFFFRSFRLVSLGPARQIDGDGARRQA
jgi:hypothetical protein